MATLREYFDKDGSRTFCLNQTIEIRSASGEVELEVIGRLHLDLESNAKYISYYIPHSEKVACPARVIMNSVNDVLNWDQKVKFSGGFVGGDPSGSNETRYTGRVYIYSEDPIKADDIEYLRVRSAEIGNNLKFRMQDYARARSEWEKPLAFIAHDSRDKEDIARPLAMELQKLLCPVWYDEFSLKVGDSLRASIEKGLKECQKCVFILTPHFLANGGWSKREYDSIFTRELVESNNLILPIWHNVTATQVYEYSPVLADRKAVQWSLGVERVAGELVTAIRT